MSRETAARLADALREASYVVRAVEQRVGGDALRSLAANRPGSLRRALDGDGSALATLAQLFLVGDDVSSDDVARALPLDSAGPLLEVDGGRVRAAYELAPYGDETHDWWVVSDRTDDGRPRRADHVLGVGGASTTLAQLTTRRPVSSALDLGTGCGVQALHLSTHADHVVATDVLPRAAGLARTTFALSDVDVEVRIGDLDAPVADREFDLVVCNPPFVVGPSPRYAYRDGAWSRPSATGDDLSRRAVQAAAARLAPGGVAQLLVNWLHVRGEDWRDRAASWVAGLGVDALLLERDAQAPPDYVATWLADAGEAADAARYDEWCAWLDDHGVEAVGFGWVVLRRSAAPHRVVVESAPQPVDQPLGEAVAGWLDRIEWLRERRDPDLLRHAFRAADGVRRDTAAALEATGWRQEAVGLRLADGFRWTLPTDDVAAALVAGCDGARPLQALVSVLAPATGQAEGELAGPVCDLVRRLVDRGLLLP